MPKTAFQNPNRQRTYPKYGSELEARIPTQEISLQLKPSSVHDAYSHNMLSNNSKDLETGYREPEAESHSKDLAAFSESIHENRLQENHANGHPIHDTYKTQDNGKGSKRKAWEMERKASAVEIQARKKVEQDSRIVRVSRVTGGKDRHSKVLTEKGLRDRRVRLSIPTAIQLYDLQDRLGLEQPSKAVDWLIQAAKSALDALTVLDTEMASASAGNMAQLTSSDCSNAEHCAGSPRESATATAASALSTFGVCQGTNSHNATSGKVTSGKVISITTMKESDLGRSSSSTSDGSIKGSAIHTSSCSMSKPVSRMEARFKARLKAKERASKKSSSAKTSVGSLPAIHQLKSMQPSLTSLFNDVFPYNTLPLESQCSKDDNPCGIRPQVMSRTSSVQQLLDYNSTPSYTDMLCTQDSLPFQNMASSLAVALQKSFPPVPNTLASMQAVIGSSILQSYEMIDSAFPFFPPKQSGHLESNAAQNQGNLFSNIPNMIMKSVERQQQQQAQMHSKHFASTIVPTFSNDINFSTSSLSSREPLQSNSSSTTNMPSFSHTQKNTYGVASAKSGYDFVPLEDYNVRAFQESHNVQDNVNHEHNHPWAKEKHHR